MLQLFLLASGDHVVQRWRHQEIGLISHHQNRRHWSIYVEVDMGLLLWFVVVILEKLLCPSRSL